MPGDPSGWVDPLADEIAARAPAPMAPMARIGVAAPMVPMDPLVFTAPVGVWVAYLPDFSSIVVFEDELSCLRYAVASSMLVRLLEFGSDLTKPAPVEADAE